MSDCEERVEMISNRRRGSIEEDRPTLLSSTPSLGQDSAAAGPAGQRSRWIWLKLNWLEFFFKSTTNRQQVVGLQRIENLQQIRSIWNQ